MNMNIFDKLKKICKIYYLLYTIPRIMQNTLSKRILEKEDILAIKPNYEVLKILWKSTAERAQVLFFDYHKKTIYLLTTNSFPNLKTQIVDKLGAKWYKFEQYYTDELAFKEAINWYDRMQEEEQEHRRVVLERQTVMGQKAEEMIKKVYDEREKYSEWDFMEELIKLAFQSGSSDLHFQPEELGVVMRIRKDWILKTVLTFSHQEFRKYLIKLKFMSGVRINIDYMPQDWRFDFKAMKFGEKVKIDVRVSFMPWLRWDNIVMRYLDSTKSIMTFTDIGFDNDSLPILTENIKRNYGMILLTWPTWSWKTTTLYSMLHYLNDPSKKIITLEDPVEYEIPGLQQSQINEKKWYTYEEGLKSILRQDPDVIMVWEIRSRETAEIAINAALTWHLVLSTLHTNSSVEAVSRLLNLWVKPYMLAPALNLVIGQRLLRKLHKCKSTRPGSMWEIQEVEHAIKTIKNIVPRKKINFEGQFANPVWCDDCGHDGYKWRIAAVELFELNEDIKKVIIEWKSSLEIYSMARQNGYITMK